MLSISATVGTGTIWLATKIDRRGTTKTETIHTMSSTKNETFACRVTDETNSPTQMKLTKYKSDAPNSMAKRIQCSPVSTTPDNCTISSDNKIGINNGTTSAKRVPIALAKRYDDFETPFEKISLSVPCSRSPLMASYVNTMAMSDKTTK